MKKWMLSLLMAVATVALVGVHADVEAKRLGGGKNAGMQRSMPAKSPDGTPAKPAQPANGAAPAQQGAAAAPAAAGAQAAAPKRSWMGPIAGLAAGLGIAALMSHLGMGEQFGNFLMMALLAVVAVVAIRWLIGRFGRPAAQGPQLAGAGAPLPAAQPFPGRDDAALSPMQREARGLFSATPSAGGSDSPAGQATQPAATSAVPADFDAAGFERIAKMIFIRLQAANDAGNVDDLRRFTTPELFASLRLDLQERGAKTQQTDVMQLDAELVDTVLEGSQYVASVRFHGLIREEEGAGAERFNELWHLVKPAAGQGEWAIAGITPLAD